MTAHGGASGVGLKGVIDRIESLASSIESRANGAVNTTSGVHFHGNAGLSVISIFAIIVAVSAVVVVSIQRRADAVVFEAQTELAEKEMVFLKERTTQALEAANLAKAYTDDHEARLSKLEK